MKSLFFRSMVAGIIATAIMTLFMMIAPYMGLPKMSAPHMLSAMLGISLALGWMKHFAIGIIFALAYSYLGISKWNIQNIYFKGAVFGMLVFVFAQIMMMLMKMVLPMPSMEGAMLPMMIGSLLGHIVYGIAVSVSLSAMKAD